MSTAGVRVEADGPLRIVTFDRHDRFNAIDREMHAELAELWPQFDADLSARVVVLRGEGPAFCGGGDLGMLRDVSTDLELRREIMREAEQILTGMLHSRLPVVAAVRGPAVGLGCSVLLCCDIVLLSETAYLADPHVAFGLVAGDGGAAIAPLLASPMKVKEFLLTGRRIGAAEAERIGLATRVVADNELWDEAVKVAGRIAALPPAAVQSTLRAVNMHLWRGASGVMDFALEAETRTLDTPEYRQLLDARVPPPAG